MAAARALNVDLLKRLCETPGVPGREERVRALIEGEIEGLFDEVKTDAMGNLLCKRGPRAGKKGGKVGGKGSKGAAKKVMLLCHMDQIGFYVRHIDNNGFLRVNNAGGFDTRNLFSRRVKLVTGSGDLPAVMNPGGRPIHIASEEDKKKIPDVKELLIDTGLTADEVKKKVKIGDYLVYHEAFLEMGNKLVSPAMDNRVACWLGIEAIRQIEESGVGHACEIHVALDRKSVV